MKYIGFIIDRCSIMGKEEGLNFNEGYKDIEAAIERTKNRLSWPGENGHIPFHVELFGEYDWDYFNRTK